LRGHMILQQPDREDTTMSILYIYVQYHEQYQGYDHLEYKYNAR
jgi:hypothetical protein